MHGKPAVLPQRPIHHSLDRTGRFALTCYNTPSNLTVHRINEDGTVGAAIEQPAGLDLGIYAHQIVTMPGNRSALMVTRGNRPEATKPEDPGALKIYGFSEGRLSPLANLPVGGKGGHGYGPRHVDFHPTEPWVYVSVESQNELHMHRQEGDSLSREPLYKLQSTVGTYEIRFPQAAGGIHVHPDGRAVYLSNRANATVDFNGRKVFRGGENNIAVFSIDPRTGEPRLIQHADPQSFHVRTFSIDPGGKLLVAASIDGIDVREGDDVHHVSAALTVFRIAGDGRLTFVRKYDVETGGGKFQWWTGFVALP
jgi:6-phosphogluconolactonase (cycloisomerase 2 family)